MKNLLAIGALVCSFAVSCPVFAGCSAKASTISAKIVGTGDTFANFSVQGKPCSSGCSGHVNFRIHFIDAKGNKHFYGQRGAKWSSDAGEPVEALHTGYESYCNSMGPCEVLGVEITDVSCYN